jgi:FtsP/CotA-like multicopper oxidase with cupredoxin domain
LLRVRQGDAFKLRFANRLQEPTSLSFPGLRLPNTIAAIGGLTAPPLAPDKEIDVGFTPGDSGFNLYLPRAGAGDSGQQGRGLFGPIIVDEPSPPAIDLDAVVVTSDWLITKDGDIEDNFADPSIARGRGRQGATILANAQVAPLELQARPRSRVRLRLANAATARMMTIGVEGATPQVIAIDGQPSEPFPPLRQQFPLSPAARIELMFDMPPAAGATVSFVLRGLAGSSDAGDDRTIAILTAKGEPVAPRPAIAGLPANPLLPTEIDLEAAKRFDVVISGGGETPFAVNGETFVDWSAKPAFALAHGAPCVLAIANKTAVVQVMRLHGHVARLLHALDDGWEPYWRDIIVVAAGKTSHIAFVADNPGKWPFESAIPEHRAAGVGAWFQVG